MLDASAVLALLNVEPGGNVVADHLGNAHIASVNLCEVIGKLIDNGHTLAGARNAVAMLALTIEPVDEAMALNAAAMRRIRKGKSLSLGDRLCLALGLKLGAPVLTADQTWGELELGVEVTLIR